MRSITEVFNPDLTQTRGGGIRRTGQERTMIFGYCKIGVVGACHKELNTLTNCKVVPPDFIN